MANNPELLKMPLARDGQKNTIPETATASAGIFSQQYGWQSINALPPQAGGKAVKREDFNGAFNLLGGIAFMAQKGFTFKWSADQDYYAGCVVIDDTDGLRYECIADVTANNTAPSADATHWQVFSAGTDMDAWFRQPSTQYGNGTIALLLTLPTGLYLECTGTGGITSADDLVITSPSVGNTVTDGTVVWTIRKIANTANIPAPVDISGKANTSLNNLTTAGENKIKSLAQTASETGFTIIYPNGGSKSSPANIKINSRYVETNPFSGYRVACEAEVFYNNEWGTANWASYWNGSKNTGIGVNATQLNDGSIIIQSGEAYLLYLNSLTGSPLPNTSKISTPLPCRVKVWKIGKITN